MKYPFIALTMAWLADFCLVNGIINMTVKFVMLIYVFTVLLLRYTIYLTGNEIFVDI